MAVTSSFTFLVKGNTVYFTDTSTGAPTSFSWSFGDGSPENTDTNPVKTYTEPGVYTVRLVSSNIESKGEPYVLQISVGQSGSGVSAKTRVLWDIPDFLISRNPSEINTKVNYFINLSMHKVGEPLGKPSNAVEDESIYSVIEVELIAKVTIYEFFNSTAIRAAMSSMRSDDSGAGPQKKIVTGPGEAEWFDPSIFYNNMYKDNGMLKQYEQEICKLAARLGINLPYCDIRFQETIVPTVTRRY